MTDKQNVSPKLRVSDCPALSICEKAGTTNNGCRKDSLASWGHGNCQASIVLLLDRLCRRNGLQEDH